MIRLDPDANDVDRSENVIVHISSVFADQAPDPPSPLRDSRLRWGARRFR